MVLAAVISLLSLVFLCRVFPAVKEWKMNFRMKNESPHNIASLLDTGLTW